MVVVAVPGGTSGLGRAIAEAIKARGNNEIVILSRKDNPELGREWGIPIVGVDYGSIDSLKKSFEKLNVHTVVSAVKNTYGGVDPDVNLVQAAAASKVTKRFIPSEWGAPLSPEQYEEFPYIKGKRDTFNLVTRTDIESSIVHIGFFMDYWGMPYYKSYITPFVIGVDLANNMAAIPGSGNTPSVLTHTSTVAAYVAAYVEAPKWEDEVFIVGDRITMNEILQLAEKVKETKFKVVHNSLEDLKAGKFTKLPGRSDIPEDEMQAMLPLFGQWFEDGTFNMKAKRTINDMFPEIKPLTMKELLEAAWRGR